MRLVAWSWSCLFHSGLSTDAHISMHSGHYVSSPMSLSVPAGRQQVITRQDCVAATNHAAPPSSRHMTSSSSLTSKSVSGDVLLPLTGVTTISSTSTHVSSPTTTSLLSLPGHTASNDHKPPLRPVSDVLTSSTRSEPISRTSSLAVRTSGKNDDGLMNTYKVGPTVLDCQMKSELVWTLSDSVVYWALAQLCCFVEC